jgi:sulfur relay (sulfurtransferase) complex TusBCD TusD component (DsrE family)
MNADTVLVFSAYGMGQAEAELQLKLARTFLGLMVSADMKPGKICFYTEGVKLACEGSPVLESLIALEQAGVELLLCRTCLDYYGLTDKVKAGIVGGMPDIIDALDRAVKLIRA